MLNRLSWMQRICSVLLLCCLHASALSAASDASLRDAIVGKIIERIEKKEGMFNFDVSGIAAPYFVDAKDIQDINVILDRNNFVGLSVLAENGPVRTLGSYSELGKYDYNVAFTFRERVIWTAKSIVFVSASAQYVGM